MEIHIAEAEIVPLNAPAEHLWALTPNPASTSWQLTGRAQLSALYRLRQQQCKLLHREWVIHAAQCGLKKPVWESPLCSFCLQNRHVGPGKCQDMDCSPAMDKRSALARRQVMVPGSITHPPYHICLAVSPCWLCLLLLHDLISTLTPWHLGTGPLYICPRQLQDK